MTTNARRGLFWLLLAVSQASLAVDYSLPADIGSGAFINCSGAAPNYTCTGDLEFDDDDTLVLTADVTLNVGDELKIGKDVNISSSGFVLFFDVTNKVEIGDDSVVEADITAGDEFKTKDGVFFTGNIVSGDKVDIDKNNLITGNVTAGGELKIDDKSTVIGVCSPEHPRCDGGTGQVCTVSQIATDGEEFRGISGSSDSNVIAAGKDGGIYHYDGTNWVKNAFVSPEDLNDVEVLSPSLAFAAGKDGTVLQYNGTSWSTLPIPLPKEDLFGVWAASATEVWVAGKNNSLHLWNGSSWSNRSIASQANVDNGKELTDIWGDASSVYALEKDGDLYRYSRSSGPWAKFAACNNAFDMEAWDIWGDSAGKVYISGKNKSASPDSATVFIYDENSNSCTSLFASTVENVVEGIYGSGGVIYAVGEKGLVLDNSSGSWRETYRGAEDFKDVWVSSTGVAYFAGKNGFISTCEDARIPLDHFIISPTATSASTCLPNAITITAVDAAGNPLPKYINQVNVSTSTNHGNWSVNTGAGVLSPSPDNNDDGAVDYTFDAADASTIILNLSNTHAETLTITVADAVEAISSSTSDTNNPGTNVTFSENVFVISEDPIQIAGKPQAMTVAMWTDDTANSGSCGIDPNYNSSMQALEVSIDRNLVLPAAVDPTISTTPIPDGPATATITLDFSSAPAGQASFNLDTTDVGQYFLTVTDTTLSHSDLPISGASAVLTVRPFGLAVTNINAGGTPNPSGTAPGDNIFTSAGSNFSATVSGVLWESLDDSNGDGLLDTGRLFRDNSAITPSFAADTTLVPASTGFTPVAGVAGALSNGTMLAGAYTNGVATVNDLQYSEVGSFTLLASATGYLGVADVVGDTDLIIGRFIPASFLVTVTEPGVLNFACGTFSYIGQDMRYAVNPKFTVSAMTALPSATVTTNYRGGFAKLNATSATIDVATDSVAVGSDSSPLNISYTRAAVSFTVNNNGTGTVSYVFGNDILRYGPDTTSLAHIKDANSEVIPFTANIDPVLTQISDGEVTSGSLSHAFDITGHEIRFGRLKMSNVFGSELSDLIMPMKTEYLDTNGFYIGSGADSCSMVATVDLGIADSLSTLGSSTVTVFNPTAIGGVLNVKLTKPGAGIEGSIQVTPNLAGSQDHRWLRYDWNSTGEFDTDPTANATFGIYKGNVKHIYTRQIYQ